MQEAINDYLKRISRYMKIKIIELPNYLSDNIEIILEQEKEQILKNIKEKDYIITMEIEGKQLDSISFSNKVNEIFNHNPNISFIIGGSYGIHQDIKNISNYSLSFSKMTFPHQLFRLILLEQIYRCFKIQNNEVYHK